MRQIFVNLPVKDLERSKNFFQGLGFRIDPQFTNDKAACVVVEKDATKSTEVLVCLSCSSDTEVKELVKKASAAGGKPLREAQDHGFMYQHAFEDPDGHIWELVHMRGQPS